MRIGQGYDVHRLCAGRPLVLGGVKIEHPSGLLGHSDADVLTHAVCDALLGAAGLGDLGGHFPDTDARYKGICSLSLLRECAALVRQAGYRISNVDCTIVAQAPRLSPYIAAMRTALAEAAGIAAEQVNVKATTEEGLGFTGEGAGIAVHAVALLE